MNDLISALNTFASKINTVPFLNRGGCGVIAAHIAKRLEHIVPTRVVVFSQWEFRSLQEIRNQLKNPHSGREWAYEQNLCFGHLMVEFDFQGTTYLFDSNGVIPNTDEIVLEDMWKLTRVEGYLTIDEVCALSANPIVWNSMFDRSCIPSLRKKVTRFFKKIKVEQLYEL